MYFFQNEKVDNGIPPPNLEDVQLSFVPGVLFDKHPFRKDFGDCLLQPPSNVYKGEMVKVRYEDCKKIFKSLRFSKFLTFLRFFRLLLRFF